MKKGHMQCVCVCIFCNYKHLEPKLNLRTNKQVPLHIKKQQVHVVLNMFEFEP